MQREGEEERKREEVSMHMEGRGEKTDLVKPFSSLFVMVFICYSP
jgi:hypothetical protein